MRVMTIGCSMIAALLGTAACKKTDSEKAATEMRKAGERIEKEGKDVQQELGEKKRDLSEQADLGTVKAKFQADMKLRLGQIDMAITELEAKPEPEAKERATALRVRRDEVQRKLDTIGDLSSQAGFDELKKDVTEGVDKLEQDVKDARK